MGSEQCQFKKEVRTVYKPQQNVSTIETTKPNFPLCIKETTRNPFIQFMSLLYGQPDKSREKRCTYETLKPTCDMLFSAPILLPREIHPISRKV
jgi:hypothetical protein